MAKLIWAVIQEGNLEATLDTLRQHRIGVTQMGSTGGFLRKGNVTLIIGVEDGRSDEAMAILRAHCQSSQDVQVAQTSAERNPAPAGNGVAFVLDLWNEHVAGLGDDSGDRAPA